MNSLLWNRHQIHAESGWLPRQQPCHYCTSEHLLPGVVVYIIYNLVKSSKPYLLQQPAQHLPVLWKLAVGGSVHLSGNFLCLATEASVVFSNKFYHIVLVVSREWRQKSVLSRGLWGLFWSTTHEALFHTKHCDFVQQQHDFRNDIIQPCSTPSFYFFPYILIGIWSSRSAYGFCVFPFLWLASVLASPGSHPCLNLSISIASPSYFPLFSCLLSPQIPTTPNMAPSFLTSTEVRN